MNLPRYFPCFGYVSIGISDRARYVHNKRNQPQQTPSSGGSNRRVGGSLHCDIILYVRSAAICGRYIALMLRVGKLHGWE